jgi:hypothetical protein
VLHRIKDQLQSRGNSVRICVRSLGSPEWGDVDSQVGETLGISMTTDADAGRCPVLVFPSRRASAFSERVCIGESALSFVHGAMGRSRVDGKTRMAG